MSTSILPFAFWSSGTNQNSIPANDNSLRNQIINGLVISQATTAQPGSPTEGDIYIIAATHTGAQWSTFTPKDLAIYSGGTWYAFAPVAGVVVNVAGVLYKYESGAWAAVTAGGFTNPMTATGDLIKGGASGAPGRLAIGTTGDVLTVASGAPAWAAPAAGFANPMTTAGDIIKGGSSGVAARVAVGSTGDVLTVVAGAPAWAAPAAGFTNPMTTSGDVIYGGASGVATRLPKGSDTQVLTLASGLPTWATPAAGGMTNPMTTIGDVIVGSTAGAAIRLANGTAGQVLTAVSGAPPAWADPVAPTIPQNSKSAAYTLVLADAGKHIFHPSADTTARIWTIPANSSVAYPIGTALTFINQNAGGVITLAITTDTMRLAGAGTTGSRTLAANGIATAIKVTATEWLVSGTGLT